MDGSKLDIAIIGAGMAGLACANLLADAGYKVTVFDKGRGPGGRMSTRRAEILGKTVSFDHGAQFFTARDKAFKEQVDQWRNLGFVKRWEAVGGKGDDVAWVGIPGMNGPIRALANELTEKGGEVVWATRIETVVRTEQAWMLSCEERHHNARTVLVATPSEQTSDLLENAAPELAAIAAEVRSRPCWAVMAAFPQPLPLEGDCFSSDDGPIRWAARNSAKPFRQGDECWVLHASPKRSRSILNEKPEAAAALLLADFFQQAGVSPVTPIHLAAHRWLYALAGRVEGEPRIFDAEARVGIAGDYLHSPRVEGAWLSGRALAQKVISTGAL